MVNRKRRPRAQASAAASPSAASPPPAPTATETTTTDATSSDGKPGSCGVSVQSGASEAKSAAAAPLLARLAASQARASRSTTYTTAGVAARLYEDFIRWAVTEVAVQHRLSTHLAASRGRTMPTNPRAGATGGGESALQYGEKSVTAECYNCRSTVSASRYAQHLEKCLGRGGRVSSRAASARLKASAERQEREESDEPSVPRRRRGQADEDAAPKSTKRRRSSPVPAGAVRAGLPPSGRSRGV